MTQVVRTLIGLTSSIIPRSPASDSADRVVHSQRTRFLCRVIAAARIEAKIPFLAIDWKNLRLPDSAVIYYERLRNLVEIGEPVNQFAVIHACPESLGHLDPL